VLVAEEVVVAEREAAALPQTVGDVERAPSATATTTRASSAVNEDTGRKIARTSIPISHV
jgi:hypothetical protein